MSPEQHLQRADQIISQLDDTEYVVGSQLPADVIQLAIAHALIALAAETGVPHGGLRAPEMPGAGA